MNIQLQNLTNDLRVTLQHARREAERRHNIYLDVEHLMLGLLRHASGPAYALFQHIDVDPHALYDQVAGSVGMERDTPIELKDYARTALAALERTEQIAHEMGHAVLDTGHLLLSLMAEEDGAVHDAFATCGLTLEDAYAFLRKQPSPAPSTTTSFTHSPGGDSHPDAPSNKANIPRDQIILVPTQQRKKRTSPEDSGGLSLPGLGTIPNWLIIVGAVVALFAYIVATLPGNEVFTFMFVLVGWIFSLTLHEFAHALVAYIGGDHTVKDKGYLSFNPLKYMHPLVSIGLPLLFLAMGGIGLPGGAVYIERHRLKNKWWGAAVAAAGPAANLLLALLLALPFVFGMVDSDGILLKYYLGRENTNTGLAQDTTIWTAVAFLIMLQISAVFFNLLPIPPLDGFHILEPFLDPQTRQQLAVIGFSGGLMLLFFVFWFVEPVNTAFWEMVYDIAGSFNVPRWMISEGLRNFRFWMK